MMASFNDFDVLVIEKIIPFVGTRKRQLRSPAPALFSSSEAPPPTDRGTNEDLAQPNEDKIDA